MPGYHPVDIGTPNKGGGAAAAVARAVALAISYAGRVPYVWGGTTPSGFDCSGLVQYVFKQAGISLPRTSEEQANVSTPVQAGQLQAGDLVFSSWGGEDPHGHVAIYTGGGKIVEAPHTGEDVHVVPLDASYLSHVTAYRRVLNVGVAGAVGAAGGIVAGNDTPAPADNGGLLQWPSQITDFFTGATDLVTGNVSWIKAFFQPSTYVRIGAGLFGMVFLVAALIFLVRETKS